MENKTEKEKLTPNLIEWKKNLVKSKIPENIVRDTIISYILNDNNKRSTFKVKKEKVLTKNFIDKFLSNNIYN